MDADEQAPAFVVRNEQRLDVSGTKWPGCKRCGHVYSHSDECELFLALQTALERRGS